MNLPSAIVNLEFFEELFQGKKQFIRAGYCAQVNVPKYPELSTKWA